MEAIAPGRIYLFGLPITDTVVSTWVMMVMLIIIALIIRKYAPHIGEFIIEMINSIVSSVMPEDVRVIQFLPFLGTLALFLVLGIFSASSHSWCPPLPTSTQPLPCHCWSFSPSIISASGKRAWVTSRIQPLRSSSSPWRLSASSPARSR